ncbi:MAG: hypothetical protein OEW32_15010 [Nitrospira sp.]|nr:hypothetical protein [Nitrospira sp.]
MEVVKSTVQWVEQVLRSLSGQKLTGTVTIRFSQGGIQGIAVNQELNPPQQQSVLAARQDT